MREAGIVGTSPEQQLNSPGPMRRLNHPVYRNRVLQVAADAAARRARLLPRVPAALPRRAERLAAALRGRSSRRRSASSSPASSIVFAAFGLYQKWWRYVSGRDFLLIVRAVAVASAILVVVFTVAAALRARPAALGRGDGLPPHPAADRRRPARRAADRRAALARRPRAQARGAGGRRRLRRPDGRPRAAAQPQPRRDRDRLRRRRPAQAGDADAGGLKVLGSTERDRRRSSTRPSPTRS